MNNAKKRLEKLERQEPEYVTDIVLDWSRQEGEPCEVHRRKRLPGEKATDIIIDWSDFE